MCPHRNGPERARPTPPPSPTPTKAALLTALAQGPSPSPNPDVWASSRILEPGFLCVTERYGTNVCCRTGPRVEYACVYSVQLPGHCGLQSNVQPNCCTRFFYFYTFYFRFLQKYIFVFKIYRNIPRPPRCRAARTWSPRCGAAGLFCKNFRGEFALKPLEDRSPDNGTTGPPGRPAAGRRALAARLHGDRSPNPI